LSMIASTCSTKAPLEGLVDSAFVTQGWPFANAHGYALG